MRLGDMGMLERRISARKQLSSAVGVALRLSASLAIVIVVLALALIRRCADGGAMAGVYQSCDCRGFEWQQYDRTAADGPRRTFCLGLVRSRTCYQFRSGPETPCAS